MSKRTYSKINEVFLKLLNDKHLDLVIYRIAGGEPLLVFNEWKLFASDFLNNSHKQGFISLITNMTILTDEMIEFFKCFNLGFGISLDGFYYSKPFKNGESSANKVMDNIDRLIKNDIVNNIDISTVIDNKSFDSIEILAKYIAERGLSWGIYLDHYFCGEISSDIIVSKIKNVLSILDAYNYDIFSKLKFNNIKITGKYEGCTAGEKLIAISTNGNIYPCQTSIYGEKITNIFDESDLIKTLETQKTYNLGYNYTTPDLCMECCILDICGGSCKMNNKEINKKYTCKIIKQVVLEIVKIIFKNGGKNAQL